VAALALPIPVAAALVVVAELPIIGRVVLAGRELRSLSSSTRRVVATPMRLAQVVLSALEEIPTVAQAAAASSL
jgi:hypothetical protein